MAVEYLGCACGSGGAGGTGCANPKEPLTSVGLCLADGTPIAVTMTRDCAGAVTSEGWVNLRTGAYTTGVPPVGTVACGESSSIQVSGTFCSVDDATGDVLALILIEYTYAPDGSIASTRLVNAVDGTTYTVPAGATITTCPTGTEQPEQDFQVLCDVNAGVVTQFIRDYRRDQTGAIVAFSNYTLAGADYTPTGTVGLCQPQDCETEQLCDVREDVSAVLPSTGVPTEDWQTLANGVRWMRRGNDGAVPGGWYNAGLQGPERFDFDRPVNVVYTVRFSDPSAAPMRIPMGWYLDSLNTAQHSWDSVNRIIAPTAFSTLAGLSTFRIDDQTTQLMIAPLTTFTPPAGVNSQYGQITVTTDVVTPFLRTLCRSGNSAVTRTDTTLDGTTAYVVVGTADRCSTDESAESTATPDSESVILCDSDAPPNRFLRTYAYNESGEVSGFSDTTLAGAPFVPVGAVGICGTTNTPTPVSLSSQGRLIGDSDPAWTPGADVDGILTSVTLTVLSGTATVTDANGTVMAGLPAGYNTSWSADDHSALTGPQSIDAVGGQTVVVWTQR